MERTLNSSSPICVLIPAYNEEDSVGETVANIHMTLVKANVNHNILVINDHSEDSTEKILKNLMLQIPVLNYINNLGDRGFGNAIRLGLDNWQGEILVITMADASDDPNDILKYYLEIIEKDVDCVFGSRFMKSAKVKDYPIFKLFCNRVFNSILQIVVNKEINDYTNAFKAYKRVVIENCKPFQSNNFSLTIEIPLKAIEKQFSFSVLPINWTGRKYGYSKLNLLKNTPSYIKVVYRFLGNKYLKNVKKMAQRSQ